MQFKDFYLIKGKVIIKLDILRKFYIIGILTYKIK